MEAKDAVRLSQERCSVLRWPSAPSPIGPTLGRDSLRSTLLRTAVRRPPGSSFTRCPLSAVDVATGWFEPVALPNRSHQTVEEALKRVQVKLPFPVLGIDSDNDSAFLNWATKAYCDKNEITFTRCRPYKKNDQAHVEQKNWAVVRQLIGYDRYEGEEATAALQAVYDDTGCT
jgi:hypothetical protein